MTKAVLNWDILNESSVIIVRTHLCTFHKFSSVAVLHETLSTRHSLWACQIQSLPSDAYALGVSYSIQFCFTVGPILHIEMTHLVVNKKSKALTSICYI